MSDNTPPAGWYPDPHDAGQQRYWDGATWTEHTAPSVPLAPGQGQGTPPPAFAAPAVGMQPVNEKNWFLRHKIISAVLVVLAIAFVGNLAGGDDEASDTVSAASDTSDNGGSTADTAADEAKAEDEKPAEPVKLSLQERFLSTVEDGIADADEAENEIQIVQARKQRADAMCGVLPGSRSVRGWTGTVDELSTELGGDKAVLTISLTDDVKVSTWNNSLSDIGSDTLIDPSSDLYASIADLEEGDEVHFDGKFIRDGAKCIEEQSLIDENGMLTPTFSFKFTGVAKP